MNLKPPVKNTGPKDTFLDAAYCEQVIKALNALLNMTFLPTGAATLKVNEGSAIMTIKAAEIINAAQGQGNTVTIGFWRDGLFMVAPALLAGPPTTEIV